MRTVTISREYMSIIFSECIGNCQTGQWVFISLSSLRAQSLKCVSTIYAWICYVIKQRGNTITAQLLQRKIWRSDRDVCPILLDPFATDRHSYGASINRQRTIGVVQVGRLVVVWGWPYGPRDLVVSASPLGRYHNRLCCLNCDG